MSRIRDFFAGHKTLAENATYVTVLQIFLILAPLITYPYLVRVLGRELYGVVLTAQMLASYASLVINFGSNEVCAKHVSLNRDDKGMLSEVVNSVLCVRGGLFLLSFIIYFIIVMIIPAYREYITLFLLTYLLTLNDVLFPQFFFQGIEKMKFITIISVSTKVFFIALVFLVVRDEGDYLLVPLLYAVGYALGAIISLVIIYKGFGLKFFVPKPERAKIYVKDSSAIFATDIVCTIKDKVNYLLVGSFVGMSEVVIYDLGLKLNSFISKPLNIITTVMLPRFAKSKSITTLKKVIMISFLIALVLVLLVNCFMPLITRFFIGEEIDYLPLRLFLLAPLFLSISVVIYNNLFVAFGYNKYAFYSIVITTIVYVLTLLAFMFAGKLTSVYSFIAISLISYFTEFVYRIIVAAKLAKNHEA